MSTSSNASKKRKLSDEESVDVPIYDSASAKAKKAKLSAAAPPPPAKSKSSANAKTKDHKTAKETKESADVPDTELYPNGFFYCHQCTRKRDMSHGIHCTFLRERGKGGVERCRVKYCGACLKNRYQEDIDSIKSRSKDELSASERPQHVSVEKYFYKCPRCRDECNCRVCRKAKGLEPTGNFNLAARKAAKAEAAARGESAPSGPSKLTSKKSVKSQKATPRTGIVAGQLAGKPSTKVKPKARLAKPLPRPTWTRVPTDLSLSDAEARIHIREFAVRFASVLQIAHSHLEELDEVSGDNLGETSSWHGDDVEAVELISWVSDLCAKSIVQGLLDVIAGGAEARGDDAETIALKEAIKAVKNTGANLNRLWTTLVSLRDSLGRHSSITFADPLPPPAAAVIRTTRQNRDSDALHIANSAQLIPTIVDLIDAAIGSPAIRDALEAGPADEKEYGKLVKEAIASENSRWKEAKEAKEAKNAKEPKQKGETKAMRDNHHNAIEDLEQSQRLLLLRCIPRLSALGRDHEGRTYYAMTPGFGESEAAINLLRGKNGLVKVGRRKGGWTADDRKEMDRWSWFVAVWGKKPEGADEVKRETSDDEDSGSDEDDSDEECWWGFWEPEQILKMAEWLEIKCELDDEAPLRTTVPAPVATNKAKTNGIPKNAGIRKHVSASSSALSSLSTSHASSTLSDISDLSDDDDDDKVRIDFRQRNPSKREVRSLVDGMKDFAELLTWRARRSLVDTMKEKPKAQPVPTKRFYA